MTGEPRGGEDLVAGEPAGGALVKAAAAGTAVLVVVAVAGVVAPEPLAWATAAVSGALFLVGVVAFLYGYARGVVRSREEQVTFPGLFFLSGTSPRTARVRLRAALVCQVVVAVAAAGIRPYTAVAFAVLAPMHALGLMAAWGARHGRFRPK